MRVATAERNTCTDIALWTLQLFILITLLPLTFIFVKHDYSKKFFEVQQNFFRRKVKNYIYTFYLLTRLYLLCCLKLINSFYVVFLFRNTVANVCIFPSTFVIIYDLSFFMTYFKCDNSDKLSSFFFLFKQ